MWVEETKNGKYKFVERYEDYLTGKIRRVSVTMEKNTAQTRKVAQRTLDEKIEQVMRKTFIKPNEITLKQLIEKYNTDLELTVKLSTRNRNYYSLCSSMKILGEDTMVNRLTAKYIRDKFLATGNPPGMLNEYLRRFKTLIRWGFRNDYIIDISFLDKLEPFTDIPHKMKIQDKYLETDELHTLLQDMNDEAWILLTKFLVLSGLRFGEFAALLKSDIDLENDVIHVTKNYDPNNNIITTPKTTSSIRDIYIQEELKNVCRQINAIMLRRRLMNKTEDPGLFFFSTDGDHVHYYAYNKYLKEHSLKAIGRPITAHALRHTHASLLLEKGMSIDAISRRLGHDNSKITREIYLHVTKKLAERDNEQMSAINIL